MNISIEKVKLEDAAELLGIYGPFVRDTAISFEYEVPSIEEFQRRINDISSKYPYIKAVENGKIIGYAYANTFKGRKAYDWSVETTIYVDKNYHGKGVGRLLYDVLEKSLVDMGIINMNACIAAPIDDNQYVDESSQLFHKKMGFCMVGKFHKCAYKFDRWFDMVWMEKTIGEHGNNPSEVKIGCWDINNLEALDG